MQEIKGMFFSKGHLVVMNPAGEFFTCPRRPGVCKDKSGYPMPRYDEQTNQFVCGSDQARSALWELLTHTLVCQNQPLPAFIVEDELLGSEVAAFENEWRIFAASQGLNGETLASAA